ncbi:unnamed protein product [Prorocentrum cordatum]|uniref:Transglutaminase-like domain-containing protein n=1 Tax=Prorocentrum cordatum TaxID=2364126 RepID=A0ABN9YB00_9DINO|nr:unnamed protein product [Polarella glacialis]
MSPAGVWKRSQTGSSRSPSRPRRPLALTPPRSSSAQILKRRSPSRSSFSSTHGGRLTMYIQLPPAIPLQDDGAIWVGSSHYRRPRAWFFGQYEEGVLDACLKLVEMFTGDRGNVVLMARHLSSAVNQLDNGGVLVGNWSGDYEGGKAPTAWVGSPSILTQWAESGPVKFGQCWVFSGVLTAVCRCLGIPARIGGRDVLRLRARHQFKPRDRQVL